jgi:hypothetical protein
MGASLLLAPKFLNSANVGNDEGKHGEKMISLLNPYSELPRAQDAARAILFLCTSSPARFFFLRATVIAEASLITFIFQNFIT